MPYADPVIAKTKAAERQRRYRALHREKHRAYNNEWMRRNRGRRRQYKREAYWANPDKYREYLRLQYHKHRDQNILRSRLGHLRRQYGISQEEYGTMFRQQNGACALCSNPPSSRRRLCVDHDHKTGRTRGLLCIRCNTAVGYIESAWFPRATEYLRQHHGITA